MLSVSRICSVKLQRPRANQPAFSGNPKALLNPEAGAKLLVDHASHIVFPKFDGASSAKPSTQIIIEPLSECVTSVTKAINAKKRMHNLDWMYNDIARA